MYTEDKSSGLNGRGIGAMLLATLLVAGCQPGDAGNYKPVIEGAVERGDESRSAVVRDGAVSATMTARWAAEAPQSAYIVYRNNGAAPVSVILPRLALRHERLGKAPLWVAADMANVDRDDARTDNDEARVLYEMETSPATSRLLLKPRERRALDVEFTNFPGIDRIARGDRVTATVPLGATDRTIEMVAE